jgi:arsenate reductase
LPIRPSATISFWTPCWTHPILINRPFVTTPMGTRLCRPSEMVLDILPQTHKGTFFKEDGEQVLDAEGKRRV